MIFRTFIAPVFAAMTAIQPVSAMQQVPAGFEFLTDSTKGDLYFGKPMARSGPISFIKMFTIQADGSTEEWVSTFNCTDRTYKSDNTWKPVNMKSVGSEWLKAACK